MIVFLTFGALKHSEPSYEGVLLSKWLDQFSIDKPVDGHEKAVEAVRRIGSNALPLLIKRLCYRDNVFEKAIYSRIGRQDIPHSVRVQETALSGFKALGPAAAASIPELRRLSVTEPYCLLALGAIGPKTLPILSSELTNSNPQLRAFAVAGLRLLGDAAEECKPSILALTRDQNFRVRLSAILTLGDLKPSSSNEVLCALSDRLDDSENAIRAQAAIALGKYGGFASEAIPILESKLNDPSPYVSSHIRTSLEMIRSEVGGFKEETFQSRSETLSK
jgi:hypothetical protein